VFEYVLRSRRVVRPEGVGPAAILVRGGRIADVFPEARVTPSLPLQSDIPVTDVGDSVVMPGLVDTHVHIHDPGRADREGFATATGAAAAGGVTTLIDMPSGSVPPTTSRDALDAKCLAAAGRIRVDVGFWGGLVPQNMAELSPLKAVGVFGYKCYLCPSGLPEFPEVSDHDLLLATEKLGEAPLLVHAESGRRLLPYDGKPESHASYLASRPRAAENEAIAKVIRLSRFSRTPIHILHLSSAEALENLSRARQDGVCVTAETCPHYLVFASEEIADGGTEYKCAPPIRERENRERLWQGLADGTIDMIVSDHVPSPPELKKRESGDFREAATGVSSLGLTLSAVWTAARERGFGLSDLSRWLSEAPARLAGLTPWKGAIAAGRNADFVVWNPDERWLVEPSRLRVRHKLTPWAGRELAGVVEATYLKGRKIYDRGQFLSTPRGEILLSA
jgi:allantoinase